MLETGQPDRKTKPDMKSKAGADVDLDSAGRGIADSGSGPSPVDFAYLRRYTLGDASLEREVLELFCSHAPGLVADLASASSEKAWRDAAHSLKGSALSLGIWEVAREAERAEAASAQYIEAGDIVTNLARMVDDVRSFVAALYLHA
jgi:HPt (histidine-containing phosphotransfer) domain-containing protein